MASWIIAAIAVVSTAVCIFLWFRDVYRVMRERRSIVESAAGQLAAYRAKAIKARNDPEIAAVLERSEKIYRQAVDAYQQVLQKPWNWLPACLMGFHDIDDRSHGEGIHDLLL